MASKELGSSTFETSDQEPDAADKNTNSDKKTTSSEKPTKARSSERASKDIGRSIFARETTKPERAALFEAIEKTKAAERPDNEPSADTETHEAAQGGDIERLDPEEMQHVSQELAREHLETIQAADETTTEELQPAADFLERVEQGEDHETAFAAVAAEAGMSEDEIAEALNDTPESAEDESETEDEAEPETNEDSTEVIDPSQETEGEVDLSTPPSTPAPTPAAGTGTGTSGTGGGGPSGGSGGSGSGSGSGPGGGGTGSWWSGSAPAPGSAPTPSGVGSTGVSRLRASLAGNIPPAAAVYYENRRAKAGQLLVVGLVGYLIGRRRGRINAEKRLVPVQKKLEKQIDRLEKDLTYKEQVLVAAKNRAIAAERLARRPSAEVPASRQESKPYLAAERTQPGRQETRLGMEKPARAERLGHMVIAAESPRTIELPPKLSSIRPERVKDMDRTELLELSEKIIIEGASLRKIYESNLVGERQLRHLISEHLKGKDIRAALRHEMVEHEIDFERDPMMRDRIRSRLSGASGGSGGLNEMLASVGITNEDHDPELARRVAKEERQAAEAQQRRDHRRQLAADSALITAVVVLAVAVLILALRS